MSWLFLLCALLACLAWYTARPGFFLARWRAHGGAILRAAGLAEADAPQVAQALAAALHGDAGALVQVTQTAPPRPAFNEKEITHMADVAGLYALARAVTGGLALALLVLSVPAVCSARRGGMARLAKGALWGALDVALLLLALGVWAALDFRAPFWLFHRLAFTNDLWLLDPRTDLLIRLMPQSFFEETLLRVAALWLFCLALWCGAAAALIAKGKRGNGRATL
ncbi:MAG: DUF1461 domain-containing protein [Oscillospiraceae bacterium]|nr:DUF1461 domain-containing protein [Oscillospiraceae bacterium]